MIYVLKRIEIKWGGGLKPRNSSTIYNHMYVRTYVHMFYVNNAYTDTSVSAHVHTFLSCYYSIGNSIRY